MVTFAFFALLILYFIVGIKIDQWITISRLGFILQTPQGFVERPRLYDFVRLLLFGCAAACLVWVSFDWYLGLASLLVAWFATTWLGQRLAFDQFRAVCREIAEHAGTAEEKASALENSRKTNSELRDMDSLLNKYRT